jgi:TPR repeat protein
MGGVVFLHDSEGHRPSALKYAFAAVILLLSFAAPVAAGPLEDATAADDRGDYATALRLLRELAEQGNARAQFKLGGMYDDGRGVAQNDAEALKWYRLAADQGYGNAQYNLALMYGKVRACRKTILRRRSGLAWLPNKARPSPSTISGSCTMTAGAWRRTMQRR